MSKTPNSLATAQNPQALIQITEHDGKKAVSARELHAFLESKRQFADWIKDRIRQYNFVENQDYVTASQIYETVNGGHSTRKEYALTVNMAKELSMVEGNEKGKQARQYFIAREEQAIMLLSRQLKQSEERTAIPDARRKPITFDNLPAAVGQLLDEVNLIKKLLARPMEAQKPQRFDLKGTLDYLNEQGYIISRGKLQQLTASHAIPCKKFGRRLVFERTELDKWAEEQTVDVGNVSGDAALTLAASANCKLKRRRNA